VDDTKKILRTIVNGQSAMKSELLGEIQKLNQKLDKEVVGLRQEIKEGFKNVNQRLDRQGKSLSYLEDDSPTRDEHDKLERRVTKLEQKSSFGL
jgi:BMFP domain-containing protein YqiC